MSGVLTVSSTVQCGHLGAVAVVGTAKLTVGGNAVLVEAGVAGKSVSGCSTPSTSNSNPCTTVQSVLPASIAQKLTVQGQGVVLDTLNGTTDGIPIGALLGIAGQTRLTTT